MSRDFKQEYEQYMSNETPDLWARIEAKLPVKEATAKENGVQSVAGVSNVLPMEQRKGISKRWMTYGMTAAAALLICILAVPVLRGAKGGRNDSANFMAKDAAMPEMIMEDAADAGGAENGGAWYDKDGAAPEMVMQEADYEAEEEMAADDYDIIESINDSAKTGAAGSSSAPTETEKTATTETAATPVKDAEESKVATFTAEVTILEIFEQDGKVYYKAEISGQEAILLLGDVFTDEVVLSVGGMYKLSLETAKENVAWDYVIVGM